MVDAKEMDQFGIIPVDQGVYFLNTDVFQMIHKFSDQLLANAFVLLIGINADGIQGRFLLENTIFSHIEFSHYKPHQRSIFFLRH